MFRKNQSQNARTGHHLEKTCVLWNKNFPRGQIFRCSCEWPNFSFQPDAFNEGTVHLPYKEQKWSLRSHRQPKHQYTMNPLASDGEDAESVLKHISGGGWHVSGRVAFGSSCSVRDGRPMQRASHTPKNMSTFCLHKALL